MGKSRKEKARLNIISSAAAEFISILNGFILPRLILLNYGSGYNGITSSISQFLSLISILTIGVTASTRVALYRSLAENDIKVTSAIVRAAEKYMRKVGSILLVYIFGLACIYPLVVKTDFGFWEISSLIVIIGLSSFAEYFFGITYGTFLLADQCVYISNCFTILATTLNLALTVILIKAGCSIQLVKLGSAVVFVIKPILQHYYVSKKYQLDKHCEPDMSALHNRRNTMMHAVANIVHDKTDLVVLTLLTDVKTVSVYTVYNLVLAALIKLQNIFTNGTEAIFGNMWAKGEMEGIRRNLSIYEFFISAYSSVVYSVTLVMILPFVKLYTHNITDVEYIRPAYAGVIIAAFVILSFRTPYLALVQGIGHYRQTRNAAIWEAGINLLLSVAAVCVIPVWEYKIVGVAIGTLAANLFRTIHYALYVDNHVVRRGRHVFALRILWTACNICLISLPGHALLKTMLVPDWWHWLAAAFCSGVYAVLITMISALVFYRKDLFSVLQVLRNMARNRFAAGRQSKP